MNRHRELLENCFFSAAFTFVLVEDTDAKFPRARLPQIVRVLQAFNDKIGVAQVCLEFLFFCPLSHQS